MNNKNLLKCHLNIVIIKIFTMITKYYLNKKMCYSKRVRMSLSTFEELLRIYHRSFTCLLCATLTNLYFNQSLSSVICSHLIVQSLKTTYWRENVIYDY